MPDSAPSRRRFLGASLASAAAASASPPPAATKTRLGLDAFSLRSQGWSATEFLDFAARNGAEVVNYSEPRFLGSLAPDDLKRVREYADGLDLALEVGFGSICPTSTRFNKDDGTAEQQLERMFGVAKFLGSPIVRCYLGSSVDRTTDLPLEAHIENTVKVCRNVREKALEAGIKIAVENHAGDMQALQLKGLIEEAGKDFVGALVDAGNAAWTLEDPVHTLETLAPYALTSGVRDSRIWETEEGASVMWVPFGKGNVGIERWKQRLSELRPDLTFELEIINLRTPRVFAYRKPEFWETYRDVPAWVFAGFEKLAREGRPYTEAPQPPAGVAPRSDAFNRWAAEQERRDVEADLAFSREKLGLGRSA